jgi:toxin FitB
VSAPASGYLLDTNYLSELVRVKPDPRALSWIDQVPEVAIYLSVVTLAEIRKGIDELATGARRAKLDKWLTEELPLRFAVRILPVDAAIADRWGALAA